MTLPSTNFVPGTSSNIVYVTKMDVGTQPATVNNVQVNLGGTYDNDDLSAMSVYYNTVGPNTSGAFLLGSTPVTVSGPHSFSFGTSITVAAGTVAYFVVTVNVDAAATINNTVSVNGATNPLVFGYTTVPNVIDNQSNAAGTFNFNPIALPLKLTSFSGKRVAGGGAGGAGGAGAAGGNGDAVRLDWTTSLEENTRDFAVEWSTDGLSYFSVGTVAAQGNSSSDHAYTFTHLSPVAGFNNYRLKMSDLDGAFKYSPVVTVHGGEVKAWFSIAGNPVGDAVRLVGGAGDPIKMLRIFDMGGRVVWQSAGVVNTGMAVIPFASYGNGMYTLEITLPHSVERIPFIKTGK